MEFLELSAGPYRARFLAFGARWVSFLAPDRVGRVTDVLLGYSTPQDYQSDIWSFGAVVGRYANRIRGASFDLEGREIRITQNHGMHHLHGGAVGFAARLWTVFEHTPTSLRFNLESAAFEEGFPGKLNVFADYDLTAAGELTLTLSATTDAPTVLNLTNHAYFNLAGRGDVRAHELSIFSGERLEVDKEGIPSGRVLGVAGTPFDFRRPVRLGEALASPAVKEQGGFDNCFVLSKYLPDGPNPVPAAFLREEESGRTLSVSTTAPGLQLYTANGFQGTPARTGEYNRYAGLCLECMHLVDSVHQPLWPSTQLSPGAVYRQVTVYRFSAQ